MGQRLARILEPEQHSAADRSAGDRRRDHPPSPVHVDDITVRAPEAQVPEDAHAVSDCFEERVDHLLATTCTATVRD